jgi:hypothetical protein
MTDDLIELVNYFESILHFENKRAQSKKEFKNAQHQYNIKEWDLAKAKYF